MERSTLYEAVRADLLEDLNEIDRRYQETVRERERVQKSLELLDNGGSELLLERFEHYLKASDNGSPKPQPASEPDNPAPRLKAKKRKSVNPVAVGFCYEKIKGPNAGGVVKVLEIFEAINGTHRARVQRDWQQKIDTTLQVEGTLAVKSKYRLLPDSTAGRDVPNVSAWLLEYIAAVPESTYDSLTAAISGHTYKDRLVERRQVSATVSSLRNSKYVTPSGPGYSITEEGRKEIERRQYVVTALESNPSPSGWTDFYSIGRWLGDKGYSITKAQLRRSLESLCRSQKVLSSGNGNYRLYRKDKEGAQA